MKPIIPFLVLLTTAVSNATPQTSPAAETRPTDSLAAPPTVTSPVTPGAVPVTTPDGPRRVYPGLRTQPAVVPPTNATPALAAPAPVGRPTNVAWSAITLPPGQPIATNADGTVITNYPAVGSMRSPRQPGVAAQAAPGAAMPPARSNITPKQFENINRLDVALHGLEVPTHDPSGREPSLLSTLEAAPIAKVRPSNETISRLGNVLAEVVPSLRLTAQQRRQLAIDLNLALNSGNLSTEEAQRLTTDFRRLLQGSTVSNRDGVNQLLHSVTNLVADIQAQAFRPTDSAPVSNTDTIPSAVGQGVSTLTGQGQGTTLPSPQPAPPPSR